MSPTINNLRYKGSYFTNSIQELLLVRQQATSDWPEVSLGSRQQGAGVTLILCLLKSLCFPFKYVNTCTRRRKCKKMRHIPAPFCLCHNFPFSSLVHHPKCLRCKEEDRLWSSDLFKLFLIKPFSSLP